MPKYKPRIHLPEAIRAEKTFEKDKIKYYILSNYNKEITDNSIDSWLSKHPKEKKALIEYVASAVEKRPTKEVTLEMLDFKVFKTIPEIKAYMIGKGSTVKTSGINRHVNEIRNFCLGVRPGINPKTGIKYIGDEMKRHKQELKREGKPIVVGIDLKQFGWTLKHPERITQEDMLEYEYLVRQNYEEGIRCDTSAPRLAVKNFLEFHHRRHDRISGLKHRSAGTLKTMTITKEQVNDIFDYLRESASGFTDPYYQAYVAIKFIYQTGTRISATLNADLKGMSLVETTDVSGNLVQLGNVRVYDKGQLKTYGEMGHEWDKKITKELYYEMINAAGKEAKPTDDIFRLEEETLRQISRECIEKYAPEIIDTYPLVKVVHFWRHIMGQHMLIATNWNYGIVAAMGGWTVKSLEESYGGAEERQLREFGAKYLPVLMRDLEAHE